MRVLQMKPSGKGIPSLPKSKTGFVGLKNLGCICYLNATMQNLFLVSH
jgi:uncharacterized UBP type Zn finger protein